MGEWGLSCFEMTGDGGCTLGGMRWNRSGCASGKWAAEQGAERRQPQSWLLEEGRRWVEECGGWGGGGEGAGWGKRT